MFETLSDRIAGTLLMGLDVAVEFATLGEVRLVDPSLGSARVHIPEILDAAPLVRRRARTQRPLDPALLPSPSTALARATVVPLPEPPAPKPTRPDRHGVRTRATARVHADRSTDRRTPARVRGGAVKAPVQLCLLSD